MVQLHPSWFLLLTLLSGSWALRQVCDTTDANRCELLLPEVIRMYGWDFFFFCAFLPPLWKFFFILYCLKFFSPFKCAPLIYSFLSFCPISFEGFFFSLPPSLPLSPFSFTLFAFSGLFSYHSLLAEASCFPLLVPFVVFSVGQVYLMKRCFVLNVSASGQLFNEKNRLSIPCSYPSEALCNKCQQFCIIKIAVSYFFFNTSVFPLKK